MTANNRTTEKKFALGYILYYTVFLLVIQFPLFHNLTADLSYNHSAIYNIFGDSNLNNLVISNDDNDPDDTDVCLICDLLSTSFDNGCVCCSDCILDKPIFINLYNETIVKETLYLLPSLRGPPQV